MSVIIVDYGVGNLKSVQRGLEKAGATVQLSSDPDVIASADYLVLPGVGAFEDGMKGLEALDLVCAINTFVDSGNPLLGICLGMQMLMEESHEYGLHDGLALISGEVVPIPTESNGVVRRVPHIGWNQLITNDSSAMASLLNEESFYFVHSYMVMPEDEKNILASCRYLELDVIAAVQKDNVMGTQFHPEKSGVVGLKVLESFLRS